METKIAGAHEVLKEARDRLHQNEDVPVQIIPEPENPVDKAFKCRIDSKWFRFGYAVTEVTDQLHSRMHNLVMGVTFKEIHFVCWWSKKCMPGFMQQ